MAWLDQTRTGDRSVNGEIDNIIAEAEGSSLGEMGYSDQKMLQEALRDGWRLTPATLAVKITNGAWIAARHLLYISTIVATEIAKGGARIILTMPFRHGKSEFLSINTPIWFLEKWPGKYVMTITYGLELATDFSLRVRETFLNTDLHHLLRTRLNRNKLRVDRFLTTKGGGLTAAGIGGPIVGRGADLMLIDDYIKNAEEAMSRDRLKKTFEWFKSTAYTRLEPDASLVVLATRWDHNDLIALLQNELPHENWKVINLPAIAMVNDPLGREVGEALWPERYDLAALSRIKATLGPYWWAAECQQDPLMSMSGADLGSKLKTILEEDMEPEEDLRTIRCWDLAATKGGGDFTAGPKISRSKVTRRIYIREMARIQENPAGVKALVKAAAEADGHGVKIWMEQEPGSSGVNVITDYSKELKAYAFEGEKATGPIEVRASPLIAAIEIGNVYMVDDGIDTPAPPGVQSWNQDLRDELNGFPDGDNDDQVVGLALGYNKLVLGISGGATWGRDLPLPDNVGPIRGNETTKELHIRPRRTLTW